MRCLAFGRCVRSAGRGRGGVPDTSSARGVRGGRRPGTREHPRFSNPPRLASEAQAAEPTAESDGARRRARTPQKPPYRTANELGPDAAKRPAHRCRPRRSQCSRRRPRRSRGSCVGGGGGARRGASRSSLAFSCTAQLPIQSPKPPAGLPALRLKDKHRRPRRGSRQAVALVQQIAWRAAWRGFE